MTPKQKTLLFSGIGVGAVALIALIWALATPRGRSGERSTAKAAPEERTSETPSKPVAKPRRTVKDTTPKDTRSPAGAEDAGQ